MAYDSTYNYGYDSLNYEGCPHCGRRVGYTQNLCDDCRRQYAPKTPTIDAQLNSAERRVMELLAKKEAMAKFGSDEDYGLDDAILFKRSFHGGYKTYTYVAVKTKVGWFITGMNPSRISFEKLVEDYLLHAGEVWSCTEWQEL
jgi:hypothetical protein